MLNYMNKINNSKNMKKLIITASLLMMGFSFAEPTCKYIYPSDYWLNGRNTAYSVVNIFDNGIKVYTGKKINITTYTIGKYKYTRGVFVENSDGYDIYNICKVSI